jgi:hypothetical protein
MKFPLRPGENQLSTLQRQSVFSSQPQTLGGSIQLAPGGNIKAGQSAYNVGTGFWLGLDEGVPKLSLGVSTGNNLTWDGDSLDITGTLTATSGTIGGFTIGATSITATNLTLDSGGQRISLGSSNDIVILDADDATYRIWAGNATAASAPFSVTKAGAISATSGTIGGFTLGATTIVGGSVTLDSTGNIRAGQTAYHTGTGFWLGVDSATPKFSIGNSSGPHVRWDGTTLHLSVVTLSGNLVGLDGNGNTLSGGTTANLGGNIGLYGESHATAANDFVLRSGTSNVIEWDNSATTLTVNAITYNISSTGVTISGGLRLGSATAPTEALHFSDGKNIAFDTTTGTKIGTGTTQKIGFWNATPIVRPSSTGETTGFTAGAGTGVNDDSTFTGNTGTKAYTIGDVVKHLKNSGLLAAS